MDFVSSSKKQLKEMCSFLGIQEIEELFDDIPQSIRRPPHPVDDGLSEMEAMRHVEKILDKNSFHHLENYLGFLAYEHHIPRMIQPILSNGAFLTAYTPYQAEASQGLLQAIFEFQSALCALTGLDVASASLYDGASGAAESCLMALRLRPEKNKVFFQSTIHPHLKKVILFYLSSQELEIHFLTQEEMMDALDEKTAFVFALYTDMYGSLFDHKSLFKKAKECGALSILHANPLLFGLYLSAKDLGCDIAVGDLQPLGLPLSFGGPYSGYLSCKKEYLRQLPGRLVGRTEDKKGKKGYVLTLQAREQHIRREKATSNICTNQSLATIASLLTILWYGPEGLPLLAKTNTQRAHYLFNRLTQLKGVKPFNDLPFFHEFTLSFETALPPILEAMRKQGIEAGHMIDENTLTICVTETKDKEALDRYINAMQKALNEYL